MQSTPRITVRVVCSERILRGQYNHGAIIMSWERNSFSSSLPQRRAAILLLLARRGPPKRRVRIIPQNGEQFRSGYIWRGGRWGGGGGEEGERGGEEVEDEVEGRWGGGGGEEEGNSHQLFAVPGNSHPPPTRSRPSPTR